MCGTTNGHRASRNSSNPQPERRDGDKRRTATAHSCYAPLRGALPAPAVILLLESVTSHILTFGEARMVRRRGRAAILLTLISGAAAGRELKSSRSGSLQGVALVKPVPGDAGTSSSLPATGDLQVLQMGPYMITNGNGAGESRRHRDCNSPLLKSLSWFRAWYQAFELGSSVWLTI